MLFPTHLAAGYVVGTAITRRPLWVLAGAAVPDLVDKPLAAFGATTLYHSVAHSVLGVSVVLAVALASRRGELIAVAVGWVSHVSLDAGQMVLNGRPEDVLFLGWPVVVSPDPLGLPPVAFARAYVGTPAFWVELIVWALFVAVVVRQRQQPSNRQTH